MERDLLIEKPSLGTRFLTYFGDLVIAIISTIVLYFVILYGVFATAFNYIGNTNYINETYDEYNLNIRYGEDYQVYEEVLEDFYFNKFKDQILEDFNGDDNNYSIEYIYNVMVLNLPQEPTTSYYSNGLYRYKQNEDGSFNLDAVGVQENGSGDYFERNLADLFYDSYQDLPSILANYEPELAKAISDNGTYEAISRSVALIISASCFYILIPFLNKNGATILAKHYKIAYVNKKNCLEIKKRKVPLRPLIYFILPLIGLIFYNNYTLVILIILPLFINPLAILLNKKNQDFYEMICFIKACDLESSNVFKTEEELQEFINKADISDENYLNNLKNIDSFSIKTEGTNDNEKKNDFILPKR